jgi:hypothetical protein
MQPNCSNNKYKTSGFFTNAFSEKLTFTSAEPVLKEISKDFEICIEYLLSIIKEYCSSAGITKAGSSISFNTMLLFEKEKEKTPTRLKQYQQQYQQQNQEQFIKQYQNLMRRMKGGKYRKTHKKEKK